MALVWKKLYKQPERWETNIKVGRFCVPPLFYTHPLKVNSMTPTNLSIIEGIEGRLQDAKKEFITTAESKEPKLTGARPDAVWSFLESKSETALTARVFTLLEDSIKTRPLTRSSARRNIDKAATGFSLLETLPSDQRFLLNSVAQDCIDFAVSAALPFKGFDPLVRVCVASTSRGGVLSMSDVVIALEVGKVFTNRDRVFYVSDLSERYAHSFVSSFARGSSIDKVAAFPLRDKSTPAQWEVMDTLMRDGLSMASAYKTAISV